MHGNGRLIAHEILAQWQRRAAKNLRARVLPSSFTSPTLALIQRQACYSTGQCVHWPAHDEHDEFELEGYCSPSSSQSVEPLGELGPCQTCTSPCVTRFEFSAALFGKGALPPPEERHKGALDEVLFKKKRVIRRFMNSDSPMQANDFLRVIANAWSLRWLSDTQAITLIQQTIQYCATTHVLKSLCKKMQRQPSIIDSDEVQAHLPDEIHEIECGEWSSFFALAAKRIDNDHLSPEIEQELLNAIQS